MSLSGFKELTYYLRNVQHNSEMSEVDENAANVIATDLFSMMSENQISLKLL